MRKVYRDIGILSFLQIFAKVIRPLFTVFTLRYLSPSEIAVVTLANVIILGVKKFENIGVNIQMISTPKWNVSLIGNANMFRGVITVVLFLLVNIVARAYGDYVGDAHVESVIRVLSFTLWINHIGYLQKAYLIKNQLILERSIPELLRNLLIPAVTLLCAYYGLSFWSVVTATLVGSAVYNIGLLVQARVPLNLSFDREIFLKFFNFGVWILLGNLVYWLFTTVDNVFLSKVYGMQVLGLYATAYSWGLMLSEITQLMVTEIFLPRINQSKKHDMTKIFRVMLGVVPFLHVIGLLFLPELVEFSLPLEWQDITLPLSIMLVYGMIRVFTSPFNAIFYSKGDTRWIFFYQLAGLITLSLGLFALQAYGMLGVSVAVLLAGLTILSFTIGRMINWSVIKLGELTFLESLIILMNSGIIITLIFLLWIFESNQTLFARVVIGATAIVVNCLFIIKKRIHL